MNQGLFPDLPNETARAAKSMFNGQNPYLAVGDAIEQIGSRVSLNTLNLEGQATMSQALLALITIFQHSEYLTDRQAAEATRMRLDWKYALHLAEAFPGFDPVLLCQFRYRLYADSSLRQVLHDLYQQLGKEGIIQVNGNEKTTQDILFSVCRSNRLEWLVEGISQALESLAAHYPKWLLGVMRPYWYRRYRSSSGFSSVSEIGKSGLANQAELAGSIGKDVRYLLQSACATEDLALINLPEMKALEVTYHEQFDEVDDLVIWRMPDCLVCKQHIRSEAT